MKIVLLFVCLFLGQCHMVSAITLTELYGFDTRPVPINYGKTGLSEQQLWPFLSANAQPGQKVPAIVLIHGGAWVAGNADGFFPLARYFASRGMIAFSLDYRLIRPGGPTMSDALADCQLAVRYIRAHAGELGVDPSRIAVLGDSAGGHLAGALATGAMEAPEENNTIGSIPNAAILCNAITDLTQGDWIKFVIGGAALEKNAQASARVPNAEQTELAQRLSPQFNIRPGLPPVLDMQGLDDKIVDPGQARAFTAAMIQAGNHCELELIPHARHAFIMPKYTASEALVVKAVCRTDRFLASLGYLTGPPTLVVSTPPLWTAKY